MDGLSSTQVGFIVSNYWPRDVGGGLGYAMNTDSFASTAVLHSSPKQTMNIPGGGASHGGITSDGEKLILGHTTDGMIYVYDEFDGTLLDSFATPLGSTNVTSLKYIPRL